MQLTRLKCGDNTIKITVAGWLDNNYTVTGSEILLKNPAGLTGTFTDFANQINLWCADANIEADLVGKWSDDEGNDISRWNIPNESHRTMFALRWS